MEGHGVSFRGEGWWNKGEEHETPFPLYKPPFLLPAGLRIPSFRRLQDLNQSPVSYWDRGVLGQYIHTLHCFYLTPFWKVSCPHKPWRVGMLIQSQDSCSTWHLAAAELEALTPPFPNKQKFKPKPAAASRMLGWVLLPVECCMAALLLLGQLLPPDDPGLKNCPHYREDVLTFL